MLAYLIALAQRLGTGKDELNEQLDKPPPSGDDPETLAKKEQDKKHDPERQ